MPSPGAQRAGAARSAAAEVEAAGGMEGGGAAGADSLAIALADALSAGYDKQASADYGGVATQDVAAQETSGFDEDEADYAADMEAQRVAAVAAIGSSQTGNEFETGFMGTSGDPTVDPSATDRLTGGLISQGGYKAKPGYEQAAGWRSGSFPVTGPQATGQYYDSTGGSLSPAQTTTGGVPQLGYQGRTTRASGGPQNRLAYDTIMGEPQTYNVGGDETGNIGIYGGNIYSGGTYGEMDEGTLDPNAGLGVDPALSGAVTGSAAGAITAGAATPGYEGWSEDEADYVADTATGTTEGGTYQDKIVRDAAQPPEEVRQVATGTPEYHAIQKQQIDKSIMTVSAQLMAKAKADPNGIAIEGTNITNQRMANAFNSLDQYSKAYAATQGGSFLGGLIEGAIPFGSAVKSIQGWLESKGMYSKQTGEDLFNLMKSAVDTGDLNQIVRDIQGGGPTTEDVEGPKEIKSFIQKYPWAAELDPKYIKYLIDNPAALQDLLGEGPNNAASTPMTAPNLAANEYPPGFPGMDNLPANWATEGYTWKDPNNPNLSYSIIA